MEKTISQVFNDWWQTVVEPRVRNVIKGGAGSGEQEGHPFRGNQYGSGSGGGYKFDGKYLHFPDGGLTSLPRTGEGAVAFTSNSGDTLHISRDGSGIYGDFMEYDQSWKSPEEFVQWLNNDPRGKKFHYAGIENVAKGDSPGHPFRGNQYTDGSGESAGVRVHQSETLGPVTIPGSTGGTPARTVERPGRYVSVSSASKYGISSRDRDDHNRLVREGRIALTQSDIQGRFDIKKPGESIGIGSVIVPIGGDFKGVPLRVVGFGGPKLRMEPLYGRPSGKASFLTTETFYRDGQNTGIRIRLPYIDFDGKTKAEDDEMHDADAALSDLMTKLITEKLDEVLKGDSPGHPFRGNQYTDAASTLSGAGYKETHSSTVEGGRAHHFRGGAGEATRVTVHEDSAGNVNRWTHETRNQEPIGGGKDTASLSSHLGALGAVQSKDPIRATTQEEHERRNAAGIMHEFGGTSVRPTLPSDAKGRTPKGTRMLFRERSGDMIVYEQRKPGFVWGNRLRREDVQRWETIGVGTMINSVKDLKDFKPEHGRIVGVLAPKKKAEDDEMHDEINAALDEAITKLVSAKVEEVLKGDEPGHPFRGNQYTDGEGGGAADEADRRAASTEPDKTLPAAVHATFGPESQHPADVAARSTAPEGHPFRGPEQTTAPAAPAKPAAPAGGKRSISEIAREISRTWRKQKGGVNYAAKPYLEAMHSLEDINSKYGADEARSILNYFLGNASQFRGPDAKRLKDEIKQHLGRKKADEADGLEKIEDALDEAVSSIVEKAVEDVLNK